VNIISSTAKNTTKQASVDEQHIVIVGGGMVGISLALLLAKNLLSTQSDSQYSITLIEQFALNTSPKKALEQPSFDARSSALSAGSAAILDEIGCWQDLKKVVEPIKTVHVSDKGHFGNLTIKSEDYSVDAVGYVIENRHLGSVLLKHLQQTSVNCLAPAKVTRCSPKKNGYSLCVESEGNTQELHADLFIVADGAQSNIRESLGIDVQATDYNQSAVIANIALAEPHHNIAYERFTNEGPIALLPLSDNRAALVWIIPRDQQSEHLESDSAELLQRLQDRFGYRAGKFSLIGERQTYPLTLIQACEQVRSNLVVIGNAAHFLHPVAGQGFNLALRDCYQLMHCLQKASTNQQPLGKLSVLNQYLDKQLLDQDSTIAVTDTLVKLFSTDNVSKAVLRQLGLLSLTGSPAAKKVFAKKMMGVGA